jgi:hypothetical protein
MNLGRGIDGIGVYTNVILIWEVKEKQKERSITDKLACTVHLRAPLARQPCELPRAYGELVRDREREGQGPGMLGGGVEVLTVDSSKLWWFAREERSGVRVLCVSTNKLI